MEGAEKIANNESTSGTKQNTNDYKCEQRTISTDESHHLQNCIKFLVLFPEFLFSCKLNLASNPNLYPQVNFIQTEANSYETMLSWSQIPGWCV